VSSHDAGPTPDQHDLDAADQLLTSIARGTDTTDPSTDAVATLLRTASGPAGPGELAGAGLFAHRVTEQAATNADEPRRAPRSITLLGRVVAVKAVLVAAFAALGIAGAGAATGAIMHVVNERNADPVVTIDDPVVGMDPEATGGGAGASSSAGAAERGAASIPVAERTATCAAAVDAPGLTALATAASAAGATPTDFCRGTGTSADPEVAADEPSDGAPASGAAPGDDAAGGRGNGNDNGNNAGGNPTPGSNGATNGSSPQAGGNPAPGKGAGNSNAGGNGNAGGNNNAGGNGNAGPHPNPGGGKGNGNSRGTQNPGGGNGNVNPAPGKGVGNSNAGGNRAAGVDGNADAGSNSSARNGSQGGPDPRGLGNGPARD
jgi:hypothetical protein